MSQPAPERISVFDRAALFFVSLLCICLELFFTRILNLKTWNHVVYVVIPFATLGYGIGATFCLIFRRKLASVPRSQVVAWALGLSAVASLVSTAGLIYLPVRLEQLMAVFVSAQAGLSLALAYTVLMLPFLVIGFLVAYLFTEAPEQAATLYFWDLLGAGLGAAAFFFLINRWEVVHALTVLAGFSAVLLIWAAPKKGRWGGLGLLILCAGLLWLPEPVHYNVDRAKNWEWIPGYFKSDQYQTIFSRWHPLGRTDVYRFPEKKLREKIRDSQPGTFEINLEPRPEFSYFCTNFLAGSPIYRLSEEGLEAARSQVDLFSQAMEFPYLLLDQPTVLVIGTGGGRDIFMAKSHGAKKVIGAEINPGIYGAMASGGALEDYSGGIYNRDGVEVHNVDGRHLVKTLPSGSVDLIIFNGVDTFSGLSSGAYAYAESYLYTQEAIEDYLRLLKPDGMINFNRWFFSRYPRETLRLFGIVLEAMRNSGIEEPWRHVAIGSHAGWGMMLVKQSPFTMEQGKKIHQYFKEHETELIYPGSAWAVQAKEKASYYFALYAQKFLENDVLWFEARYPFDVSVVRDDNPFFYKYYKFASLRLRNSVSAGASGTVIFLTQVVVLLQAILFIGLFLLIPLWRFRREGIRTILNRSAFGFFTYFACLGIGFMWIEIPMMQKFTLLLGSPIYAISVTLAALLIFSGVGSLSLGGLGKSSWKPGTLIQFAAFLLLLFLGSFVARGAVWTEAAMGLSFAGRVAVTCALLLPLGLCMGIFFPLGLSQIGKDSPEAVAWAWGINCGFTVLGSMLAILLAQFLGFSAILMLAAATYLVAALAFQRLAAGPNESATTQ